MDFLILEYVDILLLSVVLIFIFMFIFILTKYKKCPADKLMVISGKVGPNKSFKCIYGGAIFIWPVLQKYTFLDLSPYNVKVEVKEIVTKQKIKINFEGKFSFAISTEEGIREKTAEIFLSLSKEKIEQIAYDSICEVVKTVIHATDFEKIKNEKLVFFEEVLKKTSKKLEQIGIRLINLNILDIYDDINLL